MIDVGIPHPDVTTLRVTRPALEREDERVVVAWPEVLSRIGEAVGLRVGPIRREGRSCRALDGRGVRGGGQGRRGDGAADPGQECPPAEACPGFGSVHRRSSFIGMPVRRIDEPTGLVDPCRRTLRRADSSVKTPTE
ncbi:hypothetical protein GCM10025870_24270 [Agromyces marinus]|uniref:Uncharacterized protein n=1 Tax=Agromyces marinus TaxID=1389020 RepID=A0ABN6YDA3_9MICO|nr:hypothetical protein GCM10025870_24270 [Agromyces marinus]